MSYIKDKIIIDFLCEVEKLLQNETFRVLSPLYSFIFGFKLYSHIKSPKDIPTLCENFGTIHQFEEFQAINEFQRRKLFLNIMNNPYCDIEQEISLFTSDNIEESKQPEQKQQPISKERLHECVQLYEKVETILFEHIAFTEEDTRFQPVDFIMLGFFSSQYFIKTPPKDIFEKLLTIRQAQISGLLNHNQKMRLFLRLHNDWNLDLNASFDKLLENPSLGTKPLSSLIVPEEQLNKILMEQLSLEEKIEIERARQEQEKKDYEGVMCNICLLDLYDKDEDIFMMDICVHNFHESCLTEYLQSQIKDRKIPVKCPEENCKSEFTSLDLKELLTPEDLEKFYQYSIDEFIKKNGRDMSYCPTAGCSYAFILDPKEIKLDCPSCGYQYCLQCHNEWHDGKCERIETFIDVVRQLDLKACPACKFWIEKTVGCNHMVCRCGQEFCYRCGSTWYDHFREGCMRLNEDYYEEIYDRFISLDSKRGIKLDVINNEVVVGPNSFNREKRKRRIQKKRRKLPGVPNV